MDDSKRIIRNLSFIKKTIVDIDSVIDILIEEEILGMNERGIILTEDDPVHSVLDIVLKKQAYQRFVNALRSTGNERVVTRLETTELRHEKERDETKLSEQEFTCPDSDEEIEQKTYILQNQLENFQIENIQLKEQQAKIREELNDKQQKLLDLNRVSCNYQKQNVELSQRLSVLRKSDTIQLAIDGLEKQVKDKHERNEEVRKELAQKTDEVEILHTLLEKLKSEVDEKSDQISMLSEEMQNLKEEHLSARSERKELKLKVDKINSNFEEKIQNMMYVITNGGGKTFRTARQSAGTFVRTTPRMRTQIKDKGLSVNNSTSPFVGTKTPRNSDTNTSKQKDLSCNTSSQRNKYSRPQQFISPQSIFSSKTEKPRSTMKLTAQWL